MALPIQNAPVYTIKLPSNDQEFKFRPFLVKEQKALFLAQQSEDSSVMVETLKQIISSCAKTEFDINELAVFDLEYIFAQIRSRSVGEIAELFFYCDVCDDDKAKVLIKLDVAALEVQKDPKHTKKIELFDDVGVMMKYPSLEMLKHIESLGNIEKELDVVFDIIISSIDYIYDSDEIHYAKEQSREDLVTFLENLSSDCFEKLQVFFETMPKLVKEVEYDCPVCGRHHKKILKGLENFF